MTRPAPYPSDLRAKGWRCEIDMELAHQSDTWALATPALRPWLLMLWVTAWDQTPCGSLPNDDELIAARLGMPLDQFQAAKGILLRRWWLADDGRLYHDVLVARVLEMAGRRVKDAARMKAWRDARKAISASKSQPGASTDQQSPPDVTRDTGVTNGVFTGDSRPSPPPDTGTSNTSTFETSSAHRAREPDDPKPEDPPDPPPPAPPDPPPKPPPFAATKAGDVGKALKAAGMDPTQINLADPEVAELIRQGATPEEFGGIAKEALSKKVESPMRWVCVVLRRRREEAAKLALAPRVEKPWHETRSGIEAKGRELGLGTWDEHAAQRGRGEQWTAYQAKVFKAAGVPQERSA